MPTIGLVYAVMPFVEVASVSTISLSNVTLRRRGDRRCWASAISVPTTSPSADLAAMVERRSGGG